MSTKLALQAVLSSAAAFAYVAVVSWVINNGERFFGGGPEDFRAPLLFLMLFVFSALVMGILLLGRPIYLFLNGHKKESVLLLGYTVASFFVFVVLAFVLLASG